MTDKQWQGMYCYFSAWLNMASVGLILVGLFQPEHAFGGLIGSAICGLAGLIFKIWSLKWADLILY